MYLYPSNAFPFHTIDKIYETKSALFFLDYTLLCIKTGDGGGTNGYKKLCYAA